jgi:CDP-diacylglycerol--serine O-phosphatidyltransferase
MINKRSFLPNFFTLTNVFLGFLAILKIADGQYITAAWLIVFASFCDHVDGKLARLTKSYSQFGKQLDSFADAISFGVAPAFLLYASNFKSAGLLGSLFCFIFILAGIFRLARFNVETKSFKAKDYKGLPIPIAALALSNFVIMSQTLWQTVEMGNVLLVLVPGLSFLMISNIGFESLPSFKPQKGIKKNIKRITYFVGFAMIIHDPSIWFFPWNMVYIFVMLGSAFWAKLHENEEELDVTVEEEKNIN